MPVHDWTRVRPGTFHDFHTSWITHLKEALNGGVLPNGYYAMSEQSADEVVPDVLTLQATGTDRPFSDSYAEPDGAIAVAERPPQVSVTISAEMEFCAAKRRTLTIRHATGDRIVSLIEILSPGNKHKQSALGAFLDKAVSALRHGYHLLLIDLFPPGPFDPAGIHGGLWAEIDDPSYSPPADKPLTLAAYRATRRPTAYVEPIAVSTVLPVMPLFLASGWYVNAPLEATYETAYRGVPERWRQVIEEPSRAS